MNEFLVSDMQHEKVCWKCYGCWLFIFAFMAAAMFLSSMMQRPQTKAEKLYVACHQLYTRPIEQLSCEGSTE